MEQRYWLVRPSEETQITAQKAHLAYRISNSYLLRRLLPPDTSGGILAIDRIDLAASWESLIASLLSECSQFSYRAILIALPNNVSKELVPFLNDLNSILKKHALPLILPLKYALVCPNAHYLVSSAISGGSLHIYLEELIDLYGADHLILEHSLTRREFSMPAQADSVNDLSSAELNALLNDPTCQPFYSPELCLNYCTYQNESGARFLLFDDERTLSAKTQLGTSLGIERHLYFYYELKEFYPLLQETKKPQIK